MKQKLLVGLLLLTFFKSQAQSLDLVKILVVQAPLAKTVLF